MRQKGLADGLPNRYQAVAPQDHLILSPRSRAKRSLSAASVRNAFVVVVGHVAMEHHRFLR